MKIKIINCKDSLLWYSRHIGETFDVVKIHCGMYWCRERDEFRAVNYVYIEDAEVIKEVTK